jgi:hypothetical protein
MAMLLGSRGPHERLADSNFSRKLLRKSFANSLYELACLPHHAFQRVELDPDQ